MCSSLGSHRPHTSLTDATHLDILSPTKSISLWKPLGKSADKSWKICFLYPHCSLTGCTSICGLPWVRSGSVHSANTPGETSRSDQTCFLRDFFFHTQLRGPTCRVCSRCGSNNCKREGSCNIKHPGKHSRRVIFKKTDSCFACFFGFRSGMSRGCV